MKRLKVVKHRPVIDRTAGEDISQEPEMRELKTLLTEMNDVERRRTIEYLHEKDQEQD